MLFDMRGVVLDIVNMLGDGFSVNEILDKALRRNIFRIKGESTDVFQLFFENFEILIRHYRAVKLGSGFDTGFYHTVCKLYRKPGVFGGLRNTEAVFFNKNGFLPAGFRGQGDIAERGIRTGGAVGKCRQKINLERALGIIYNTLIINQRTHKIEPLNLTAAPVIKNGFAVRRARKSIAHIYIALRPVDRNIAIDRVRHFNKFIPAPVTFLETVEREGRAEQVGRIGTVVYIAEEEVRNAVDFAAARAIILYDLFRIQFIIDTDVIVKGKAVGKIGAVGKKQVAVRTGGGRVGKDDRTAVFFFEFFRALVKRADGQVLRTADGEHDTAVIGFSVMPTNSKDGSGNSDGYY